ncbi:uncharacterized protein YbgA (DUF1722 family) [Bradymonas sediminis]|uniref:Uncharacterized protein n=1 Tax=Bradymonas sediminis TaxID=1548548 RepID=A0A2Z4FQT6_9DELT|nr:hypothetical protein DN745_17590 [Bradymonas sediminis]TDP75215.1 uncharacterized protein YbgA (DUF1722 family) [Bradymonas sediminis]
MEQSQPGSFFSITFSRPRIGLSVGLASGGAARGVGSFIARLSQNAQIVTVTPEVKGASEFDEVDGFIVSAGPGAESFAQEVAQHHGPLAMVTDAQLQDDATRRHFLTRVFAFAELRGLKEKPSRAALTDFQRRHKHVLMTYSQQKMRALGAIAADADSSDVQAAYEDYVRTFGEALCDAPTHEAWANAAQHMYGHFKQQIPADEKAEFLDMLADYRAEKIGFEAVLAPIREWCARYEYHYFADQTLLEPYPRELAGWPEGSEGAVD